MVVGDAFNQFDFGRGGRVAVFADEALLSADITELVTLRMGAVGAVELHGVADLHADDLKTSLDLQSACQQANVVVAIGGGRVLDLVKLALVTASNERALALVKQRSRYGLVSLGDDRRADGRLFVAVPTTFGTGSEVSSVAVLTSSARRRLVHGLGLRPDIAVLHEAATGSLPRWLVMEGAGEILTRLLGVYLSETRLDPIDGLVASMAATVVKIGNLSGQEVKGSRSLGPTTRLELATMSVMSHMDVLNLGRVPYPHRSWYPANELSMVTGVRKMTALSAVLPSVWEQVIEGEERWGSATKMAAIWDVVRSVDPELDQDPAVGLRQLLSTWGLGAPVPLPGAEIDSVASQCVRAWGGTLPMLNGLGVREIAGVLTSATTQDTSD